MRSNPLTPCSTLAWYCLHHGTHVLNLHTYRPFSEFSRGTSLPAPLLLPQKYNCPEVSAQIIICCSGVRIFENHCGAIANSDDGMACHCEKNTIAVGIVYLNPCASLQRNVPAAATHGSAQPPRYYGHPASLKSPLPERVLPKSMPKLRTEYFFRQ